MPIRRPFLMKSSFMDDFDTDSGKPTSKSSSPVTTEMDAGTETDEDKIIPVDNEIPPTPVPEPVEEISSTMKDKLRAELQAQGAYSNKKSANPILIISGAVALLVIIGGSGFFY